MGGKTITVIPIPTLTADQKEYLKNIEEASAFSEVVVRRCNCKIGGKEKQGGPPCPIHGKDRNWDHVEFDADLSPDNIQNKMAAKARGWRYDEKRTMYRDEDGALIADKFGQPL